MIWMQSIMLTTASPPYTPSACAGKTSQTSCARTRILSSDWTVPVSGNAAGNNHCRALTSIQRTHSRPAGSATLPPPQAPTRAQRGPNEGPRTSRVCGSDSERVSVLRSPLPPPPDVHSQSVIARPRAGGVSMSALLARPGPDGRNVSKSDS